MAHITVVGLGPGAEGALTREAWEVLGEAREVWLRTAHHPVVGRLPETLELHAFDALYEGSETFDEVYAAIVGRVLELGQRAEGVIYAVPGHPLVGEATVPRVLDGARRQGIPVRLVEGLSFVAPVVTALALSPPKNEAPAPSVDPLDGMQVADALDLLALHHPPFNPDLPALVGQVYSRSVASQLKLTLMNLYPDEHPVALVDAAGTRGSTVVWLPLYEVDRRPLSPLSSLYVPPLPYVAGLEGFQETIARLRAPGGCPWDREQTHRSLRTNLLEEAYEVLDALDAEDPEALREELGDLLLQVVLHAQIATEEGAFRMGDVIAGIDAKIKHRHPHVWGAVEVADAGEVSTNWEAIKRREREASDKGDRSLLDGVPAGLPALAQAYAYTDRVRRVGFEWPTSEESLQKVREELAEVQGAEGKEELAAEVGDLLMAVANWARRLGVDPESALREANRRFARRFQHIEGEARRRGVQLEALGVEEMVRLWEEAKEGEAGGA
jgi:tetrapyrrole methylase family protein/MazG family protein